MNIVFFKPKKENESIKVTIQKTGKLGFSKGASKLLDLENNKYCKIGRLDKDIGNDILYMGVSKGEDEHAYKISKAGNYYYIKARLLLEELGIDYKNKSLTVIYDISEEKIENLIYFKLIKRVIEKTKAKQV